MKVDFVTALKEAIKQQGEPVAWMWLLDGEVWDLCATKDRFIPMRSSHAQIPLYTSAPTIPAGWTQREIELFDGMIEVQERHAARCEPIQNKEMALKQKGWDLERVALLKKCKSMLSAAPKGERT
jgi:hypothetical protein